MRELEQHFTQSPTIDPTAFIAHSTDIMGNVSIGARSSIWFQCVLRGDINAIRIGNETNLQDGTIVHVSSSLATEIGHRVSCGHRALIHACKVHDEVLIGMGAIIMDGAEVGSGTIVGAGALITKDTQIPPGMLVVGSPARIVRKLTAKERQSIPTLASKYCKVSAAFASAQLK